MPLRVHSLFDADATKGTGEEIHPLLQGRSFVLEHIVSRGQTSDPEFWYDQPKEEWVVLMRGTASLQFKEHPTISMQAGDSLLLPAHCVHRVAATSLDAHWIALHFESEPAGNPSEPE